MAKKSTECVCPDVPKKGHDAIILDGHRQLTKYFKKIVSIIFLDVPLAGGWGTPRETFLTRIQPP